jgi:hypothetical protein
VETLLRRSQRSHRQRASIGQLDARGESCAGWRARRRLSRGESHLAHRRRLRAFWDRPPHAATCADRRKSRPARHVARHPHRIALAGASPCRPNR